MQQAVSHIFESEDLIPDLRDPLVVLLLHECISAYGRAEEDDAAGLKRQHELARLSPPPHEIFIYRPNRLVIAVIISATGDVHE